MAAACCRENRSRGIADLSRRSSPICPAKAQPEAEASAAPNRRLRRSARRPSRPITKRKRERKSRRKRLLSSKRRAWAQTRSMSSQRKTQPKLETAEGEIAAGRRIRGDDGFGSGRSLKPSDGSRRARSRKTRRMRRLRTASILRRRRASGCSALAKKKEEEAAAKKAAAPVSTYAPGAGLVEEEVIEGEEFDGAPHARRHKPEVHDLDDYEEETLPSHLRTGDLGEMFQEAHLDHRIQMNFDEKGGDEGLRRRGRGRGSRDRCNHTTAPRSRNAADAADEEVRHSAQTRPVEAADCRAVPCRPPTCPSSLIY